MRPLTIIVATALLAALAPISGASAAEVPDREPGPPPQVWLSGAFGRVLGADPAEPAAAAPGRMPLDTYMRRAPLALEIGAPFEDVLAVRVVARALAGDGISEVLSDGATAFDGPDVPGASVITATIETDPAGVSEHAWLVVVPDRTGSTETLFEIIGPEVMLRSSAGSVSGTPGNGCYAYLCSDVGGLPPLETMEALSVATGETLQVQLSDGSAMIGWTGTLTPLDDTTGETRRARGAPPGAAAATLQLAGLEPTSAGQWLLQLRVDYDRERGYQWNAYRLSAE